MDFCNEPAVILSHTSWWNILSVGCEAALIKEILSWDGIEVRKRAGGALKRQTKGQMHPPVKPEHCGCLYSTASAWETRQLFYTHTHAEKEPVFKL